MLVTATDFKANLGHYLEASQESEVLITRNGQLFARLIGTQQSKQEAFSALRGILPAHSELAEIKEGRMRAHESHI